MQRKVVAALVVALALALASCGGSDTLSKPDFVKQANAACLSARKATEKTGSKGINAFVDRIVAFEHAKLKGITAVSPPDELKAEYTAYKTALTQRTELIVRLAAIVKARHRITKQDEKAVAALQDREEKAATALGITECRENQGSARH